VHVVSAPGGTATTSQGHARTVFRRALDKGNLVVAEATAKELPPLNLIDALDLTMLIARKGPRRILASPHDGCSATSRKSTTRRPRKFPWSRPDSPHSLAIATVTRQ
jgi:hypothetical protein